jgi:hypothetical protein
MADGGSSPRKSLRDRAAEIRHRPGYKSRVDQLIELVGEKQQDEVLDLLKGEPLISHSAVTEVLREEFPDLCERLEINDRNVLDWRHARGIKLRPSRRD